MANVANYNWDKLEGYTKKAADTIFASFAAADLGMYKHFLNSMYHYTLHSGERSLLTVIVAVAVVMVPPFIRQVRAGVLQVKSLEYVTAARALGASERRILFGTVLPNCFGPILVLATLSTGIAILDAAGLSFLGLGAPPPTPDWGADLNLAREHMETLPYLAIFPGLAISFAVLGFNLFGDGLRDILDPRLADR